ncbi:glycerophosphodiester phosphodiesterase [Brachybacterium sp. DNPG3]
MSSQQTAPAPAGTSAPADAAVPGARPTIVGHRGAAAHAPENTLGSFRRALEDGALLLECDVHLSADGHVVVMHDETIDRTADASSPITTGALADLTRAQLDEVVLDGGERVPDLTELFAATTVPLFVEVKVAAAGEAVAALLAELPEDSPAKASTVISFHAEALEAIRRGSPATPISYLVGQITEEDVRTAVRIGADGIGPAIDGLSLAAAAAVKEAGLRLNPWTINRPEQLAVALACGADTITTDDPAWVQLELDARGGAQEG